ncbi:hypothetical protein Csa_006439, partial [Cucumis sativus]
MPENTPYIYGTISSVVNQVPILLVTPYWTASNSLTQGYYQQMKEISANGKT